MNVSREVILDLLPLVVAGEASPATRALVAEYLEQDPELARRARALASTDTARSAPPATSLEPELEALRRTRRLLSRLRWLFGLAMSFTSLSLGVAITFSGGRPSGLRLLLLDYPLFLSPLLALGLVCWWAYFTVRRRLRITAR